MNKTPAVIRFNRKINKVCASGCWEWMGALDTQGYGNFGVSASISTKAHIFSYKTNVGPIPSGLEIDHLCKNRKCVNPEHLEVVTHMTNMLRGNTYVGITHCKKGHDLGTAKVHVVEGRWIGRACRVCHANSERNRRAAQRLERTMTV